MNVFTLENYFLTFKVIFSFTVGSSKKHYALFNLTRACIMFGGHCKNKCGENEFRMVYCDVSTSLCCIRQCEPKKYK
uniref:Beta-defensin n=1 Tax=Ovis aries TaxID=9940 RepID=A0A2V0A0R3_SHEEP|nr:TPA_exp: beta defensin OBD112 [Ovis aries]